MPLPLPAPQSRRRRERGFTLLELMVVVGILGLLAAIVVPNILGQGEKAKVKIAKQTIAATATILDMYKLDVGSYPSGDQGLEALIAKPADAANWSGPYIKATKLAPDPWGKPYVYRVPSSRSDHDFDLCTDSPHGPSGGSGADAPICNE